MPKYHVSSSGKVVLCEAKVQACKKENVEVNLPSKVMDEILDYSNGYDLKKYGYSDEQIQTDRMVLFKERVKFVEKGLRRKLEQEKEDQLIEEERIARENNPDWLASIDGEIFLTRKKLDANDNYHEFESLFNTEGKLVNAKLVRTKFGTSWAIFADDDIHQQSIVSWFNPSKAKVVAKAVDINKAKGFYVGKTEEKAKMKIRHEVSPYSLAKFKTIVIYRDKDNADEVRIIDNGLD